MSKAASNAARCQKERSRQGLGAPVPPPPPPSRRYSHIGPVVDSGFNMRKLQEALAADRVHSRFRRPEPFRRLPAHLLARALAEAPPGLQLLLLDLRTATEHADCCISTALSHPAGLLSRAFNEFSAELCAFRNREDEGRIIVLTDWDERLATPAATLLWERGVENVFVLSGGLREFGARYPEFVEGPGAAHAPFAEPAAARLSHTRLVDLHRSGATRPRASTGCLAAPGSSLWR